MPWKAGGHDRHRNESDRLVVRGNREKGVLSNPTSGFDSADCEMGNFFVYVTGESNCEIENNISFKGI